jgi:histidine ammonia-lyase
MCLKAALENLVTRWIAIDGEHLTVEEVVSTSLAAPGDVEVVLAADAWEKVARARRAIDAFVARGDVVYGVTTGFGAFKDRIIPPDQVQQLQHNIVRSHAAGVGPPLDEASVRAMMLIRANTLAKGHSGVRPVTLELLLHLLNRGVHPVIPAQGSLGASGDLAPLAHMALVLVGEGEAHFRGERMPGGEALRRAGLEPVQLQAKEGLALTNGTSYMAALGALATDWVDNLVCVADVAGMMSLEALHGTALAFDPRIHAARPHPRQMRCAERLRQLLEGSTFVRGYDPLNVQDPYTLRCIPQVHGAVLDAVDYSRWVIEIELNAATDNPLVFFDEAGRATVISGGNFHGEPLALSLDYLGIAMTELGNISERRLARLTDECSNQETLPPFLIEHGGLNSGFMLVQVTAAALASENKVLAHPASTDTIPTSANIEDHVSNGATAARHTRTITDNVATILALELFAAAQAIDFRQKQAEGRLEMGRGTAPVYDLIRQHVPFLEQDTIMYPLMEAVRELVVSGQVRERVCQAIDCVYAEERID